MADVTSTTLVPSALTRTTRRPTAERLGDNLAPRDERAANPDAEAASPAPAKAPRARPVIQSASPVSDLSAILSLQEQRGGPGRAEPPAGDERRRGLAAYAAAPGAAAAREGGLDEEGPVVSPPRSFDLRA